jgi:hypothetical protein
LCTSCNPWSLKSLGGCCVENATLDGVIFEAESHLKTVGKGASSLTMPASAGRAFRLKTQCPLITLSTLWPGGGKSYSYSGCEYCSFVDADRSIRKPTQCSIFIAASFYLESSACSSLRIRMRPLQIICSQGMCCQCPSKRILHIHQDLVVRGSWICQ